MKNQYEILFKGTSLVKCDTQTRAMREWAKFDKKRRSERIQGLVELIDHGKDPTSWTDRAKLDA